LRFYEIHIVQNLTQLKISSEKVFKNTAPKVLIKIIETVNYTG